MCVCHVMFVYFLLLEVHCPVFQKPKDVMVHPSNCGQEPAKYGTMCQLNCPHGFVLSGAREELRCISSGTWSEDVQKAFCKGKDLNNNFHLQVFVGLKRKGIQDNHIKVCLNLADRANKTDFKSHWFYYHCLTVEF